MKGTKLIALMAAVAVVLVLNPSAVIGGKIEQAPNPDALAGRDRAPWPGPDGFGMVGTPCGDAFAQAQRKFFNRRPASR